MTPDPFVRTSYAETCFECMRSPLLPVLRVRDGGQMRCRYLCPCGHDWWCNWSVGAVEGWAEESDAA